MLVKSFDSKDKVRKSKLNSAFKSTPFYPNRGWRIDSPRPCDLTLRVLLANSKVIAMVPDYAATELIAGSGLRAEPPPFESAPSKLSRAWSGAQDNDCAERWLRGRISEFMAGPLS